MLSRKGNLKQTTYTRYWPKCHLDRSQYRPVWRGSKSYHNAIIWRPLVELEIGVCWYQLLLLLLFIRIIYYYYYYYKPSYIAVNNLFRAHFNIECRTLWCLPTDIRTWNISTPPIYPTVVYLQQILIYIWVVCMCLFPIYFLEVFHPSFNKRAASFNKINTQHIGL